MTSSWISNPTASWAMFLRPTGRSTSATFAWPSVVTIIPDWYYSFYGDRRILEANYEPMKKWVEYCIRSTEAGLHG